MKGRSCSCQKCLLCGVCMLRWGQSLQQVEQVEINTWRRLQNSLTRSHSSSVSIKLPSLRHFSAFVFFLLSSYTNSLRNYGRVWVTGYLNTSIVQCTSFFLSALFNMAYVEPQQTFMLSSNWSGVSFLCSCISLNSSLHCEEEHA